MFSKISRYNKLNDLVVSDYKGKERVSKGVRIIGDVEGVALHTVEDGERLDHLGYKYYRQSRHWWRICDANSDYHSPVEMLGQTTLQQCVFSITGDDYTYPYPWPALIKLLVGIHGVGKVLPVERAEMEVISDEPKCGREKFQREVNVYYNEHLVMHWDIAEIMRDNGYNIDAPRLVTQVGKQIAIPTLPRV